MITTAAGTLLPAKEISIKGYLDERLGKLEVRRELFFDELARALNQAESSEKERAEIEEMREIVSYLRVNPREESEFMEELLKRGASTTLPAWGTLAVFTLAAFSPIIRTAAKEIRPPFYGKFTSPTHEVPLAKFVEETVRHEGMGSVDEVYDRIAREVHEKPATDSDRKRFDAALDAAQHLKVNEQEQLAFTAPLEARGVPPELARGILAGAVIGAFLPIIGGHTLTRFI